MFIKESSADEFFTSLEDNLNQLSQSEETLEKSRKLDVIACLNNAAILFKKAGLEQEGEVIEMMATELSDEAMDGLTSEKMLHNLEEKGWVFNVDDTEL